MASIPAGVGVWWPGNHSAIPSNWTRNTDFDTRFNKGTADGVNPNVTGGNATHQHASPTHLHSLAGHSHSGQSGLSLPQSAPYNPGGSVKAHHYHNYSTGNNTAADSGTDATAWSAVSQAPAYFKCIYIESDGDGDGFPDDCVAYFNDSTPPTGWEQHAGSVDRFIVGADGSSGNGGATGGGNHQHADSAHTHTYSSHTHNAGGNTPLGVYGNQNYQNGSGTNKSDRWHPHTAAVNSSSGGATSSSTTSAVSANTNHEPEYVVMQAIQNTSGSGSQPEGIVAMWLGTLGNIPDDWTLCDGNNSTRDLRGKQIKNMSDGGDVGGTGGNAGHDHTDPAGHVHNAGHTHTATLSTVTDNNQNRFTSSMPTNSLSPASHYHSGTTNSSGNLASTAKTVDAIADSQPLFRTVAFISSPEGAGGGGASAMQFGSNF